MSNSLKIIQLAAAMGGAVGAHRIAYRLKRIRTMSHLEERLWGVGIPMLAATALAVDGEMSGRQMLAATWLLFAATGMGYLLLQREDRQDYDSGRAALEVEQSLDSGAAGRTGRARAG